MTTRATDSTAAAARPTLLPASAYCDGAMYERERTAIFAREWTFVADTGLLAQPGTYLGVSVAGFPIAIVNDGGALRAHQNVCRHRGGPLVS
ncbi:MAG TPA: Rieske 2Fe-2S domain-containing protein, partial [Dehalococcoidia bacterium]